MVLSFFLNIDFYVNLNERYTVFHIKSVCHSLTVHVCVCVCTCGCVCVFLCPSVCVLSFTINFFLFLRCIKNARQTQTQEKAGDFKSFTILFIFFFVQQKVQQSPTPHCTYQPLHPPTLCVACKQMEF